MRTGYRQEVLNVLLAQLLQERGVVTAPESVLSVSAQNLRRIPDILVNFQGLRTAIEGEVGDNPNAQKQALESASERVAQGIAHIGIAVVYPPELRTAGFEQLKARLVTAQLSVAMATESGQTAFSEGSVESLESALLEGDLLVNPAGGFVAKRDLIVLAEIKRRDLIWPEVFADEIITISRWPKGTHYYLSSNRGRVFVPEKFVTYRAARLAALRYVPADRIRSRD